MESFTDSAAVSLRSGQLGCLNLFGVMLPQRKTPLTANLLLSYTVCAVAFAYSLPKPIKLLMCWLGTRPIMQIRQKKKKHLSYSDHGSYLTLHSEGHRFQWSFFTVSRPCPLCSPRPTGHSFRPPESKQLLPREAGRKTESRFIEAGGRSGRGKIQHILSLMKTSSYSGVLKAPIRLRREAQGVGSDHHSWRGVVVSCDVATWCQHWF